MLTGALEHGEVTSEVAIKEVVHIQGARGVSSLKHEAQERSCTCSVR